jgi:hypothetical protein
MREILVAMLKERSALMYEQYKKTEFSPQMEILARGRGLALEDIIGLLEEGRPLLEGQLASLTMDEERVFRRLEELGLVGVKS